MDVYFSGALCEIYFDKEKSAEQKIQKIREMGDLPKEYDEDVRTIVTGQLPVVKALRVVTRYHENEHISVHIYEQPDHIDEGVREALARIFEYIKRDEEKLSGAKIPYEHWNYGEPTEAGKGWLHEYIKKHSLSIKNAHYKIQPVSGIDIPKKMEASRGDSAYIMEVTGLVVG